MVDNIYMCVCIYAPQQTSFVAWIFIPKNGTDDHAYSIHIYIYMLLGVSINGGTSKIDGL